MLASSVVTGLVTVYLTTRKPGTGLPSRREQLDWMPKARALAAMFGTDEEEEVPVLPPEELSLEDLDDDEDENGEEGLEDLEDVEPTEADITKTED